MFQRVTLCRLRLAAWVCLFVGGSFVTTAQDWSEQVGREQAVANLWLGDSVSPLLRRDLRIEAAQSCGSASCHGGPRPGVAQPTAQRGNEHSLWVENDPHAQSWRTICNEKSERMMQSLRILDKNGIVLDKKGYDNCLACHNTTKRFNEPRFQAWTPPTVPGVVELCGEACTTDELDRLESTNSFMREGVGCAACHGPGERWINTHFTSGRSPSAADGFVNNNDLYVRARMCASCHVGDADRDMNHDIIAAGHPPLRYELATYHAWLPKHWRDAEANDRTYYEAQLWIAGQIAASDASLALLNTRAEKLHAVSVWPEIAAYDCASCHHELGLDNARTPLRNNRKSHAIYSHWNDSGLRWLIADRWRTGNAGIEDAELIESLNRVRDVMESKSTPDPTEAATAAIDARMALDRWLRSPSAIDWRARFRSDDLGRMVAAVAGSRATFETWERSVQWYLAAVAARASWPGGWSGPLAEPAEQLRSGLRYPEAIDISRFAAPKSSVPIMNRQEVRYRSVELARWLGPIIFEPYGTQDDDDQTAQALEPQLRLLVDELEELYEKQHQEFKGQVKSVNDELNLERERNESEQKESDKDKPERRPMSERELFEMGENRFGILGSKYAEEENDDKPDAKDSKQ